MFLKSRLTLVITVAALAFATPVATAMPIDARGEYSKSQSQVSGGPTDVRGEYSKGQSEVTTAPSGGFTDLRSPDAAVPFERPVIVEVGGPVPNNGIDWVAVLIGLGAGAALVLLATAGIVATRRHHHAAI